MSKRMNQNKRIEQIDERVQVERLKFQAEALTIVGWLLFASVVVKSHMPNVPIEQLLSEVVILLVCLLYPSLRSLLAGDVDSVPSGKKSLKYSALGIIAYSASLAVFVSVLNYYQFKDKYQSIADWHFWMVPLIVFVGSGLFMMITKITTNIIGQSAKRRIEKQLGDE